MRTSRNATIITNIYRIKSSVLKENGDKIESVNLDYVERRLADVQRNDPAATILTIPMQGR